MTILLKAKQGVFAGSDTVDDLAKSLEADGHSVIPCEIDHQANLHDVEIDVIPEMPQAPPPAPKPGITNGMVTFFCVLWMACGGMAGWALRGIRPATIQELQESSQLAFQQSNVTAAAKQAEATVAIQKRLTDLQMAVAADCQKAGGTPEFVNQNVTCKK